MRKAINDTAKRLMVACAAIACGVCHQNGGGKRGKYFKTVLLRGIGARRQALRVGEEIARISVIRAWRFPAWTAPLARK